MLSVAATIRGFTTTSLAPLAANESNRELHLGHGMPRRKKNGQSPARHTGGPPEGEGPVHSTGYDGAGTNNFPPESSISSADKEEMVKSMKEMFSHLDREVIFIVLSECDFKGSTTHGSPAVIPAQPLFTMLFV